MPYRFKIAEIETAAEGQPAVQLELHDKNNEGSIFPLLLTLDDLDALYDLLHRRKARKNAIDASFHELESPEPVLSLEVSDPEPETEVMPNEDS